MTPAIAASKFSYFLKKNSPTILTSSAVIGVIGTAYLSGKATIKAEEKTTKYEIFNGRQEKKTERIKTRVKLSWRFYIPTVISGATTITCILSANKVSNKRAIVAQAAFLMSDKAFNEYREEVAKKLGVSGEQAIRDKIAENKVSLNPPSDILISGPGNVLCCELYTGRYFSSDMERLRRSQNDLNERLINHDQASLSDFYYLLGIPYTTSSNDLGWTSSKLLKLEFSTVLTDDGRPCLAFEYNYIKPLYGSMLG